MPGEGDSVREEAGPTMYDAKDSFCSFLFSCLVLRFPLSARTQSEAIDSYSHHRNSSAKVDGVTFDMYVCGRRGQVHGESCLEN